MSLKNLEEMVNTRSAMLLTVSVAFASICAGVAAANAFPNCGIVNNLGQSFSPAGCRPDWIVGLSTGAVVTVSLGFVARAIHLLTRLIRLRSD